MKRLMVALAAVLLLIALAAGLFLATFDADRYRPWVAAHLERAVGKPVRLDRLSLGWRRGIALELGGFAILDDEAAGHEPLLQVESAGVLVHPLPLLHREFRVGSVVLVRPTIRVSRDAAGRLNLLGIAAAGAPIAAPARAASAGDAAVSFDIGSLRIEDGTLHWTDAMTKPPTDLWLKHLDVTVRPIASGRPMDLEAVGALAGETPNLRLSARLTLPGSQSGTGQPELAAGSLERVELALERLPLEELLPPAPRGEPQLRGRLTVTVQGGTATLDPARWAKAVLGSGRVKLDEPVVANLNVLRAVFEKFAMIPGLVETLEARLPADARARLAATDTVMKPVDLSMTLEDGAMRFNDLAVETDTFGIAGAGRVGLDGAISAQAVLRIEPAFSEALVRSVHELSALANAAGELEIPLTIQGQAPRVAVLPDMRYVASKLIVTTVTDLLGKVLKRQEREQPDGGPEPGQSGSPEGDFLGRVLERVLEKHAPSDAP